MGQVGTTSNVRVRSRLAVTGVVAPSFNPVTDVAFTHVWYAGGAEFQALALSNGAAVSTWPDEVGTLDAGTIAKDPVYASSLAGLNSKPAVTFAIAAGVGDALVTSSITTVNAPFSVVVVGYKTAATGGSAACFYTDGRNGTIRVTSGGNASANQQAFNGTSLLGSAVPATPFKELWVGYYHTSSGQVEVNGTVQATGATGTQGWDGFTIGNRYDDSSSSQRMDGSIAFIGFYPGDVRSDGGWAGFKQWARDTYAMTIA
jgi:hypothetical protein